MWCSSSMIQNAADPADQMKIEKKRVWRIFCTAALFVVSIFVAVFMAEIMLRVFLPQPLININENVWCMDEATGWRLCENLDTVVNTGERDVSLKTDDRGHRVSGESRPVADPEIDILMVGDSFVEGLQVEYKDTIPGVAERLLNVMLGSRIEVVSVGTSGWNPNQYLVRANGELAVGGYDLGVIFLYPLNDIIEEYKTTNFNTDRLRAEDEFSILKAFKEERFTHYVLLPINNYLEQRSHLFVFMKRRLHNVLLSLGLGSDRVDSLHHFKKENKDIKDWAVTTAICGRIADAFEARGIPVFFVLIPGVYQVDANEFRRLVRGYGFEEKDFDIDQPSAYFAEHMRAAGLEVLDLQSAMRKASRDRVLYGTIDNHCNADGYRVIAEELIPSIRRYISKDAPVASSARRR